MRTLNRCIPIICLVLAACGSPLFAEEGEAPAQFVSVREGTLSLGYQGYDTQGYEGSAREYEYRDSGATAHAGFNLVEGYRHLYLDLDYLNDFDYRGEAQFDHEGIVRVNVLTESIYHNLRHLDFDGPDSTLVEFSDHDPDANYYRDVSQTNVGLKLKGGNYPAHLNLGYWRLERKGKEQLRYLDENCTSCHVQSATRNVDRVTEEFSGEVDIHLGPVDLAVEQVFREFREKADTPRDDFGELQFPFRPAGNYEHDAVPDSRYMATTFKASSTISGGLVANGSLTLGKRENLSDLEDFSPVRSETNFYKAAGNVTYILSSRWTANLRYRLLDLENSNSDRYTTAAGIDGGSVDSIPDNIDQTRGIYNASLSYRPNSRLTFKGEYAREDIDRGNSERVKGPVTADPSLWNLPERESRDKYKVAFFARPLNRTKLKVSGWYQYTTSRDPAYATTSEQGHSAFLGTSYLSGDKWGIAGHIKMSRDVNDRYISFVEESSFDLDMRRENQVATASFWWRPWEPVYLNLYYGYLRTRITQDLLFGDEASVAIKDDDVKYRQCAHTVALNGSWRLTERLKALFEGRYVRSHAAFSPGFRSRYIDFSSAADPPDIHLVTSEGLEEISELDLDQSDFSVGLEWSPNEVWIFGTSYRHSEFDERNGNDFDGRVATVMATITRVWH